MNQAIIEASRLSKSLGQGAGRVEALRDVSLNLRGGELTLLMGPSGSGKTTLLSLLGCMLTPDQGRVAICGHPTEGARAEELARLRREHIGFVFQSYHLFPTLSALDNVRLALDVRGEHSPETIDRAREMLRIVGLSRKVDAFPRELSGGEQQRVAIARAIVGNTSAILADEPTAALDSESGHAVMTILARIAKDPSRAVLVVTHDPRILPFANRILHIEDGRIIGDEPGAALRREPEERRARIASIA
jgi:putative ABC transport system ATP-binding protein